MEWSCDHKSVGLHRGRLQGHTTSARTHKLYFSVAHSDNLAVSLPPCSERHCRDKVWLWPLGGGAGHLLICRYVGSLAVLEDTEPLVDLQHINWSVNVR